MYANHLWPCFTPNCKPSRYEGNHEVWRLYEQHSELRIGSKAWIMAGVELKIIKNGLELCVGSQSTAEINRSIPMKATLERFLEVSRGIVAACL